MNNNEIKNYIFDLDGTLVDSSNEILKSLKEAFKKTCYQVDEKKFKANLIGLPIKEIIKNIAPNLDNDEIIKKIILIFRATYDNNTKDSSTLYDGIKDVLFNLKKSGKKLFIATIKPTKPTNRIINKFELNIFEDIYTIDKYENITTKKEMVEDIIKKYCLKKSETLLVGDSISDIISANENGIISIAALWGYEKNKNELCHSSKYQINTIYDLCKIDITEQTHD